MLLLVFLCSMISEDEDVHCIFAGKMYNKRFIKIFQFQPVIWFLSFHNPPLPEQAVWGSLNNSIIHHCSFQPAACSCGM